MTKTATNWNYSLFDRTAVWGDARTWPGDSG
jgi:hypothetical protein